MERNEIRQKRYDQIDKSLEDLSIAFLTSLSVSNLRSFKTIGAVITLLTASTPEYFLCTEPCNPVTERYPHKPYIKEGFPQNVTTIVGGEARFECVLYADLSVHFQWLRVNTLVDDTSTAGAADGVVIQVRSPPFYVEVAGGGRRWPTVTGGGRR